jgi:hypothetical protein
LDALLAELVRNKEVMNEIIECAKRKTTLVDEKEWEFSVTRFSDATVNLLIRNRYLDATEDFYKRAIEFHIRLAAWIEELSLWPLKPTMGNTWFITDTKKGAFPDMLEYFTKQVQTEREALIARI